MKRYGVSTGPSCPDSLSLCTSSETIVRHTVHQRDCKLTAHRPGWGVSGESSTVIVVPSPGPTRLDRAAQVAESGARVIATARNVDKAPGLKALAQAHARERLQVVALDVTDAASLKVCDSAFICRTCSQGADSLIMAVADHRASCLNRPRMPSALTVSCENARQCVAVRSCCVDTLPLRFCLLRMLSRLSEGQCPAITGMRCEPQAAAAEVAAENPGGIDYLIINAGTNDGHVGPSLDMCAAARLVPALVWPSHSCSEI